MSLKPVSPQATKSLREEVEKARQELEDKRKCEVEAANALSAGRNFPRMQRPGERTQKT